MSVLTYLDMDFFKGESNTLAKMREAVLHSNITRSKEPQELMSQECQKKAKE